MSLIDPRRYINEQIREISDDAVLRVYGALLAWTYALACLYWQSRGFAAFLASGTEPICWPFFRTCDFFRLFDQDQVTIVFFSFAVFSLLTAALFFYRKSARLGFFALMLCEAIRLSLLLMDYRVRMNQHYMSSLAVLTFLLVPNKRMSLKFLIPFFYFWAGTIKFTPDWLSGAALYAPLSFITGAGVPWATRYVIVLELLFVWGLWSRRRWVFVAALSQLVLFHIMSFNVVGFYYPMLMIAILSIFPLDRMRPSDTGRIDARSLSRSRMAALWIPAAIAAAHLWAGTVPGDKALTGEMRPLMLHMFDALVDCHAKALLHWGAGADAATEEVPLKLPLAPRIQCDPIVYLSRARRLCRMNRRVPGFRDLDIYLESKHRTETVFQPVIDIKNFCALDPSYSLLGSNAWIRH